MRRAVTLQRRVRAEPHLGDDEGVTLIELMVTVAIVSILAAIAVPGFQSLANRGRAEALTNELVAALNLARSDAVKRGVNVTVCPSANAGAANPTCASAGGWEQGWLVFTDGNTRGTVDGTDVALRIKQANGGAASVAGGANFGRFVTYRANGVSLGANGPAGTFTICAGGSGGVQRQVIINTTGRIRVAKGTCP